MKTTNIVKIDGRSLPPISGLTITHEKVWSSNTGRTAANNAELVGDVVGRKWKLQIAFAPLTDEQVQLLDSLVYPAFFDVTFFSPQHNHDITVKMYAGTPTYPIYSYVENLPRYDGVIVDLIEK